MLRSSVVCCLFLTASPAAEPPIPIHHGVTTIGDEKPIRALDAWLKLYRAGKIEFTSKQDIGRDSLATKYGIVAKGSVRDLTWARDLDLILGAVAKLDDDKAAQALLEVAAVGIDRGKYTLEMSPAAVREAGERAIARLLTPAAKEEICKAARGEMRVEKSRAVAYRAAAARCLGLLEDRTLLATVEPLLGDTEEVVRVNAAEAFGKLADDRTVGPLIELVRREPNDAVLMTAAGSLAKVFAKHAADPAAPEPEKPAEGAVGDAQPPEAQPTKPPPVPESALLAVRACHEALGRTTWRADMALVRFLDLFRQKESVPVLIAVLERFRDRPDDLKSGRLSGLLQFQAHELLVLMTGAVFPADQPEKWRQFWEAEQDTLRVATRRESTPNAAGSGTSGSFCGIPIQGTRVVFVLDLSGSMDWAMKGQDTGSRRRDRPTGLDFAKEELRRAVAAIAPHAQFNLITFNGDSRCELWNKDLVVATDKNRERFLKYVDGLKARGGTNLWSALEEALRIGSLAYDAKYESQLDEIFVLSDGAPSVGAVIEPIEILRLVRESNRFASIRINTAFVNTEMPEEYRRAMREMDIPPEELMRRIAEQNGGKFQNL
jgi:Mg-chelatase subunit ChlD